MIRLLFWLLIIFFIIGIINSSINLQVANSTLVITVDYVNFISNSIDTVQGMIGFFTELFATTEEVQSSSAPTVPANQ